MVQNSGSRSKFNVFGSTTLHVSASVKIANVYLRNRHCDWLKHTQCTFLHILHSSQYKGPRELWCHKNMTKDRLFAKFFYAFFTKMRKRILGTLGPSSRAMAWAKDLFPNMAELKNTPAYFSANLKK